MQQTKNSRRFYLTANRRDGLQNKLDDSHERHLWSCIIRDVWLA